MGGTSSHMQPQQPLIEHQLPIVMHDSTNPYQQPPYPDMNQIFKGIPKMMQAADDMHRLTNYMQDLRNLMFGCTVLSAIGIFFFVVLKYFQNRKGTRRRRRGGAHNNQRTDESEQSSLSISRPNYRHYNSSRPADNWTHKIEMDRMIDSTSTRHTNLTHGGGITGQHALMLNNKAAALTSPEHHHYNTSPLHHETPQQQQAADPGSARNSRAETPTSTAHMACQPPTLVLHGQQKLQQPNGQLKVVH